MFPLLALIRFRPKPSPPSSDTSSSKSSGTPSKDLQARVNQLANRLQVLAIKKPRQTLLLLSIVERFVDRALGDE